MQTPGNKRTRAMGPQPQEEMVVIRRWRRIMLRILLMIQQALVHTLTFRMNMPGFQGQRARQMSQDLDLLADEELDYLQDQILDQTQRRMSDTDSWSMASLSQKAPMTPPRARGQRSSHHNDEEEIPQCHCRRPAIQLITNKEGPNHGRTFWRCSRWYEPYRACKFFQWTKVQVNWRPTAGTPSSSLSSPEKQHGSPAHSPVAIIEPVCLHTRTTKSGSNGWIEQIKCLDCGEITQKTEKAKPKGKTSSSSSTIPTSNDGTAELMSQWEEFQQFKKMQEQLRR